MDALATHECKSWTLLRVLVSGLPCLCVVGAVGEPSLSAALLVRLNCQILNSSYFLKDFLQSFSSFDLQPQELALACLSWMLTVRFTPAQPVSSGIPLHVPLPHCRRLETSGP